MSIISTASSSRTLRLDVAPERVEVDADEVERTDLVLAQLEIGLEPAAREDAGMDARVQRLHAPAEQLGDVGQLLDGDDVDAELADVGGRASARDDFDPEVGQAADEDIQPGLVEDMRERGSPACVTQERKAPAR